MSRAKKIKYIVIHCQAGHGTLESMQAFWKTKGWNAPGYHTWVNYDGTREKLTNYEDITNGVKGFNIQCINICYRGGVQRENVTKALDTRTVAQKSALLEEIFDAINWLTENGKDCTVDLMILGHRDFSKDLNKSGTIEPWERIKECPSFDAIPEYNWLTISAENPPSKQLLPHNR
ncbi:N-acetylmuramoyl-L-alanine amidase [Flavobacterium sp. NKUCC04_CG]|nr:N-acetylmuramoyl-L-alanine amidase [Flavobacterium sp. NKUCC04_CG]MBW3519521.1 N-acetylmuramoyl-L-alanine amidase [Flavobacterium sp. NKUCC04_CG]